MMINEAIILVASAAGAGRLVMTTTHKQNGGS